MRPLDQAVAHSRRWLDSLATRPVGPSAIADELLPSFGGPLTEHPSDAAEVVDELARLAEPG